MDVAAARRDDAGGHRAAEAERIADRHHPVADLRGVAVAEGDIGQRLAGVDLEQREIGLGIAADDLGRVFAAVLEDDLDLAGVADDVVVGDDIARGIDDEAGAERDALRPGLSGACGKAGPRRRWVLLVEEAAQQLVERRIGGNG